MPESPTLRTEDSYKLELFKLLYIDGKLNTKPIKYIYKNKLFEIQINHAENNEIQLIIQFKEAISDLLLQTDEQNTIINQIIDTMDGLLQPNLN